MSLSTFVLHRLPDFYYMCFMDTGPELKIKTLVLERCDGPRVCEQHCFISFQPQPHKEWPKNCSVNNTVLGFLSYFILDWGRLDKLLTHISKKSWQQESLWHHIIFRTEIRSFILEKTALKDCFFYYYNCDKRFSTRGSCSWNHSHTGHL